ncbi:MAG: VOC family protein [Pseudomonadota bacterium]
MELAKPGLDVGLYTNNLEAMLLFWQQRMQLSFAEMLPLGGGARQHRHEIGASILKINHTREPTPAGDATGLSALTLYQQHATETHKLSDPDHNLVYQAPPLDEANLRLHLTVNNLDRSAAFYGATLGLKELSHGVFAVGQSSIELREGTVGTFERTGLGYRYMTLQVYDVVGCHRRVLQGGGGEGMPPTRLGDVAYISFVLDPDGNWIELSQRKSITGSLD